MTVLGVVNEIPKASVVEIRNLFDFLIFIFVPPTRMLRRLVSLV